MTSHITATADNSVLRVAPASPAAAAAFFGASLAFHADVSDVASTLAADGDPGFVVLDTVIRAETCLTSGSVSADVRERITRSSMLSPRGGVV